MHLSWQTTRHHAWPVILFFVILQIVLLHFLVPPAGLNASTTQKDRNNRKTERVLKTNTSASQTENRKEFAQENTSSLKVGEEVKDVEPRNKAKPLLVFHIGPHKTGTTTIQNQLQCLQSTIYKSHKIVYLGRHYKYGCLQEEGQNRTLPPFLNPFTMRALAERCLRQQRRPCESNKDWKTVFGYIKALEPWMRNENTTFLLSEENFGLGHVDTMPLFAAELRQWFRVRLVLTYRHFFEWVPSWYYENYRWFEMLVPPFVDYWRRYGSQQTRNQYELPAWKERVHPVTHLYNGWKPLVDEIVVFDMHNQSYNGSKDLLTSFMESAFPEYMFDKNWKGAERNFPTVSNPGGKNDLRVLTCAAATRGLLNVTYPVVQGATLSRIQKRLLEEAEYKIKMGMKAMGIGALNLPQECLNETELQDLFELSQHLGATVPGSSAFLDYNNSALRFQQAVDNRKFCNVDTHKLLQNETLRSFIQSL